MTFVTTIKPHWWLLGTPMTIHLSPENAGTRITAELKSQAWIAGDLFGFYPRYLGACTAAVAKASEKPS